MAKIFDVLKLAKNKLSENNISENEARLILGDIMDINFTEIINRYQTELDEDIKLKYLDAIEKRCKHIPMQYITKKAYFYDNVYYVNENVLIPRVETELLVEEVLKYIKNLYETKKDIRILDMCTGSGCIAISITDQLLKNGVLEFKIDAVDYSEKALKVACINEKNILKNKKINFINSDIFQNVDKNNKYDIIVSNPPYIPPKTIETLDEEVRLYEPMMALDGGNDGLDFYRKITKSAKSRLCDGGKLIYEIGHGQMNDVMDILKNNDFSEIDGIKDLAGLERIVKAIKFNKEKKEVCYDK